MLEHELQQLELLASTPGPLDDTFNTRAELPYGLTIDHVRQSMEEFLDFLGFVNQQLNGRELQRLESMIMPANFSSIVGEFMGSNLPKQCPTLAKNGYHNGHPDILPKGMYLGDAAQHVPEGIEVKASRYLSGWQGHNPEDIWLMVFVFESSRPSDASKEIQPAPFRFRRVVGAKLEQADWTFAGRSETSRRTITATVNRGGFDKMIANWIYESPGSGKR